jgi:quercetin dioxygenase-like cupin family protein
MEQDDNQVINETISPGRERRIAHLENLMVVVYDFSDGPMKSPEPPHSHPHEQITYVAAGELKLFKNNKEFYLREGDVITIKPNVSHCIQTLSKHVKLVDSFNPIRQEFIKQQKG